MRKPTKVTKATMIADNGSSWNEALTLTVPAEIQVK